MITTDGYRLTWKLEEHLYDRDGVFTDDLCDVLMECKRSWLLSLEPYERVRDNPMALMVFMGMLPPTIAHSVSQRSKEAIREALPIHRLVELYAPLRKVGQSKYQARCPFHEDRLASLSLDDAKGLWHCFAGCGGGDIFSFIMKVEKCDFKTALERAENYL